MGLKKEAFHFLLRLGKQSSRKMIDEIKLLKGHEQHKKRHALIKDMRLKSRYFAKFFGKITKAPPSHVKCENFYLAGVPNLKFTPENPGKSVIFYIHGGGFVLSIEETIHHHSYLPHLSAATNSTVYEVDYRVAPEHPYPAAPDDVFTAYMGLLEMGVEPQDICVMGDSAGGTLALSLLLRLKDMKLPLPAGAVVFSAPAAPVTSVNSFHTREEVDLMFTKDTLKHVYAPAYTRYQNSIDPYLYPLYGCYKGFPPMLIFVGGREMLYDHSVLIANKAKKSGVDVILDVQEDMLHGYTILLDLYEEAHVAMEKVTDFMRKNVSV